MHQQNFGQENIFVVDFNLIHFEFTSFAETSIESEDIAIFVFETALLYFN